MNRRTFLNKTMLAGAALGFAPSIYANLEVDFKSMRLIKQQRKFVSKAVEELITATKRKISNPKLAWMFENCFPNTLDTTVFYKNENGQADSYIITGDIDAMWLRDSAAQVWPYLSLVNEDKHLNQMIQGLIYRQSKYVNVDPYANAFNKGNEGSKWESDITEEMKPELHERKWEIDSLCYTVRIAYAYWKESGNSKVLDAQWLDAQKNIIKTFIEQQRKDGNSPYTFMRKSQKQEDTLAMWGAGNPSKYTGLIVSSFRPSDDATILPFLIPSNYFAVVSLEQMAEMINAVYPNEKTLLAQIEKLKSEVEEGLQKYAIEDKNNFGDVLAYEVDGFGNKLFMDDANVPSLLSLPYLGALDVNSDLYQNTRKFLLSENNPHFYHGKVASGIGGPHVGKDYIWPMSIIMQGLTSIQEAEIKTCLELLISTDANTGFMHESFHKDDADKFTRAWFAWANTLFGEFVLKVVNNYPNLV